jgi:hypothetical protein
MQTVLHYRVKRYVVFCGRVGVRKNASGEAGMEDVSFRTEATGSRVLSRIECVTLVTELYSPHHRASTRRCVSS